MAIQVATTAAVAPSTSLDRDLVRQTRAVTLRRPTAGRGRARKLLEVARLQCRKGGPVIDGIECSQCPRFINAAPATDGHSLEIRCLWKADDAIGDAMTLARAIVTVPSTASPTAADELASRCGVKRLLVVDDGRLVGGVSRSDLRDAGADDTEVADLMRTDLWILRPDETIADAVDLFAQTSVGCFPVVDGGEVVGLITRGDLLRVGVPAQLLGR